MTTPPEAPLLDLIESRARRDAGVAQVTDHQAPDWRSRYRRAADDFLAARPSGATFIGEDLRVFCLRAGIGAPSHPNAWGAMARATLDGWRKRQLIETVGMQNAHAAQAHARLYPLYRVAPEGGDHDAA